MFATNVTSVDDQTPEFSSADIGHFVAQADNADCHCPFPLLVGDRVVDIELQQGTTGVAGTRNMHLLTVQDSGGGALTNTVSWGASDSTKKSILGLNKIVTVGEMFGLSFDAFKDGDSLIYVKLTYDRP